MNFKKNIVKWMLCFVVPFVVYCFVLSIYGQITLEKVLDIFALSIPICIVFRVVLSMLDGTSHYLSVFTSFNETNCRYDYQAVATAETNTNGMPMIGGVCGIDVLGNQFGTV